MKNIVLCSLITSLFACNAFANDFKRQDQTWNAYIACSADEDCVAIHDECGAWVAVNGQFKDKAQEYQRDLGGAGDCEFVPLAPEPKTLCIKHRCTLKPTGVDLD